jgi:DNA end-binding protein Ku
MTNCVAAIAGRGIVPTILLVASTRGKQGRHRGGTGRNGANGKAGEDEGEGGGGGRGGGRALWTGAISFGLVNIPIRLYTAVKSHTVRFHELQEKTGQRIRHKRVAESTGREVAHENIVKGYEVSKGKFVMIAPDEIDAIEPRMTRTIDIEAFVDLAEIDPIVWNQTYFVGPGKEGGAAKSYELLRKAMDEMGKVGIGRFVMRTKEYLATIRPLGRGLALETMYYADEIRPFDQVADLPARTSVAPQEMTLARQLIDSLAAPWKHEKYRDTFRERVMELVQRKARGEEIAIPEAPEKPAEVVDLMQALKASLGEGGKKKSKPARPRRAAATRNGSTRRAA